MPLSPCPNSGHTDNAALGLALVPAVMVLFWLVACAMGFLHIPVFVRDGNHAGLWYSLGVTMAMALPPALIALNEKIMPWRARWLASIQAMLIALFFHSMGLFVLGWLAKLSSGSLSSLLLPRIIQGVSPPMICAMLYLSFRMGLSLMPMPSPPLPAPDRIRLFLGAGLGLIACLLLPLILPSLFNQSSPALPLLAPQGHISFLPLLFLLISLLWGLWRKGWRMFLPPWFALCLALVLLPLRDLPHPPGPWLTLLTIRMACAFLSCFFLLSADIRRWLV